jgi:hypothetical protein
MQKEDLHKMDGLLLALLTIEGAAFAWLTAGISWVAQMHRAVHGGFLYMLPAMVVAGIALSFALGAFGVLLWNGKNSVIVMMKFVDRHRMIVSGVLLIGYGLLFQIFF